MTHPNNTSPHPATSAGAATEGNIRQAIAERRFDDAVRMIQSSTALDDTFMDEIFMDALSSNDKLPLVKGIVSRIGTSFREVTILRSIRHAATAGAYTNAAYVMNYASELARPSDMLEVVYNSQTALSVAKLASESILTAADAPEKRQLWMNEMLLAVTETPFAPGLIPWLLAAGADANYNDGVVLMRIVTSKPHGTEEEYLSSIDALFRHGYIDPVMTDMALTTASYHYARTGQFVGTIVRLLDHCADPWQNGGEALQVLSAYHRKKGELAQIDVWSTIFKLMREGETAAALADCADYGAVNKTTEQLMSTFNKACENGLIMQARARMLGKTLADDFNAGRLMPDVRDVTEVNNRGQSVLTLMADRGDIGQLLKPEYWAGKEQKMLMMLDLILTEGQKKLPEVQGFSASCTQLRLKTRAPSGKFKLS
jgi:hypothetical protein